MKTMTEETVTKGAKSKKSDPIAEQWAKTMTEKFEELAENDTVFGELRNIMDMSVVAALIQKHSMFETAGLDIPTIQGQLKVPSWNVPQVVPSQCSFCQVRDNWLVTTSGGVQVDSWSVVETAQINHTLSKVREKVQTDTNSIWWNVATE